MFTAFKVGKKLPSIISGFATFYRSFTNTVMRRANAAATNTIALDAPEYGPTTGH
jgi:hypothetical protein